MQFVDFSDSYNVSFWVNDNDEITVFKDNNLGVTLVLSKWFAEYYTSVGFTPSFLDGCSVTLCDVEVFLDYVVDFKNAITIYDELEGEVYCAYMDMMSYLNATIDSM